MAEEEAGKRRTYEITPTTETIGVGTIHRRRRMTDAERAQRGLGLAETISYHAAVVDENKEIKKRMRDQEVALERSMIRASKEVQEGMIGESVPVIEVPLWSEGIKLQVCASTGEVLAEVKLSSDERQGKISQMRARVLREVEEDLALQALLDRDPRVSPSMGDEVGKLDIFGGTFTVYVVLSVDGRQGATDAPPTVTYAQVIQGARLAADDTTTEEISAGAEAGRWPEDIGAETERLLGQEEVVTLWRWQAMMASATVSYHADRDKMATINCWVSDTLAALPAARAARIAAPWAGPGISPAALLASLLKAASSWSLDQQQAVVDRLVAYQRNPAPVEPPPGAVDELPPAPVEREPDSDPGLTAEEEEEAAAVQAGGAKSIVGYVKGCDNPGIIAHIRDLETEADFPRVTVKQACDKRLEALRAARHASDDDSEPDLE